MLRFGFLGLELFIFFGRRGVVLRRVFVAFVFLLLFFFGRGGRRICYLNKSCFGLAVRVWNYLIFRKARCCFATMFLLVSCSLFCFFFLERNICYWNKSRFGLAFCVWSYCVFCLDIKVLLCDAVLSFLFCYVCFNKC